MVERASVQLQCACRPIWDGVKVGLAPCAKLIVMLRRALLVALMVMLPVQGALAASRWLCVAMSQHGTQAGAAHSHSHHGPMGATGVHEHASDAKHDQAAKNGPNGSHAQGDGSCSLCAACTVTAATPPVLIAFEAVDAPNARISSPDVSVPRIGTEGPERPPRTI